MKEVLVLEFIGLLKTYFTFFTSIWLNSIDCVGVVFVEYLSPVGELLT
jgi:hypothetical protein